MKLQALLANAALAFDVIQAKSPKIADTPIVSFPEPEPKHVHEKAALRFKPWVTGCFAFPAVNETGEVAAGVIDTMASPYNCREQPTYTRQQVYGRSKWVEGRWAMMFTYYFGRPVHYAYAFQSIVVFINNPAVENPKIVACSSSYGDQGQFTKWEPCPKESIEKDTVKFEELSPGSYSMIFTKAAKDENSQLLIMWEQLPEAARNAFDEIARMPLNKHNFDGAMINASSHASIGVNE